MFFRHGQQKSGKRVQPINPFRTFAAKVTRFAVLRLASTEQLTTEQL